MGDIKILKIQNEDKSETYRIKPEWEEDSFKVLILSTSSSAWYADVTQPYLLKLANQRAQNVTNYYKSVKQNFLQPECDVTLDIKQVEDSAELFIKRKTGDRTVLLFSINLLQQNFQDSVFNIIDELFMGKLLVEEILEISKKRQIELEKEKQACHVALSQFVKLKKNWEQQMYSNFLILLNEKKKRIKFLTDLLQRKNIDPDAVQENEKHNVSVSPEISPTTSPKNLETISDSDSNSSHYETDKEEMLESDDNNEEMLESDDNNEVEPTPSTSKHNHHLEINDDQPPVLCLPKLSRKGKDKQAPQKVIKLTQVLTSTILSENTQSTEEVEDVLTQEPLSTQELIDRL